MGSNTAGGGARNPVSCEYCVFCQVEFSATVRSLARRNPTECGVSECDLETSTVRRPRPTRADELWKNIYIFIFYYNFGVSDALILVYIVCCTHSSQGIT